MAKFILDAIKEKANFGNIKRSVYGQIAGVSLSMLLPRLEKIVIGLKESLTTGKIDDKTYLGITDLYNNQCLNNKSFKKGMDNYVGDKVLFKRVMAYYPSFIERKDFLTEEDKTFVEVTLIPFVYSLKEQLSSQMFEKVYK